MRQPTFRWNRRALAIVAAASVILPVVPAVSSAAPSAPTRSAAAQDGDAPAIRLQATTFRPQAGERPDVPPGQTISGYAQDQRGYYLVQFTGPVEAAWEAEVEAVGATILDYIPDYALKVAMNPGQAKQVERLGSVGWVGLFHPAYKIDPSITRRGAVPGLYRVRIEKDADLAGALAEVEGTGARVVKADGRYALVLADSDELDGIIEVLGVAWVADFVMAEKHNESGGGVIMGANAAFDLGYDGSGQTVAVADTGLGDSSANGQAGAHPDISVARITAIYDHPAVDSFFCYDAFPDGPQDVDSGHGTHTTVSVLGDGSSGGLGRGTAPGASLVFQAVEDYLHWQRQCTGLYEDGYYLTGLPSDLHDLFGEAYNGGARIHSNSWGSAVAGAYTADSASTDDFIFNNPEMTITFSAGNEGIDGNSDGVIDPNSIGSPGTAKNAITVGASENQRDDDYPCDTSLTYIGPNDQTTCPGLGGFNDIFTYGGAWPTDYPAEPLLSDPSAGDAEQMAAFSSRGPTDDGRIKPDVVAPGTWILSGYSDLYQEAYDGVTNPQNGLYQYDGYGYPYNEKLKYLSGTSMSNPLVAGGAAVVRQYYDEGRSDADASAALVKATLINSAVDLLDENNDGVDDNAYPIPNIHEGWGRVDLAAATAGTSEFVDGTTSLATEETAQTTFEAAAGRPLKITLVWSDAASTETAAANLVNDLNLVVTAPDGTTTYLGNDFAGGWSTTGGSADSVNNVENVYIQNPAAGTWTVDVVGANVPTGPQPYALVMDQGTCDTSYEPNDSSGAAAAITSGDTINAAICPGNDVDYYAIDASAGDTIVATLNYDSSSADLDVAIIDTDGTTVLASSAGTQADSESVSWDLTGAGMYFVRLTGVGGVATSYRVQTEKPFSVSPQGDWVGAFGADGYALAAWEGVGAGDDLVVLPGASLTVEQGDRYQWQVPTGDVRALEAPGETERRAATWYHASQVRVRLDFAAAYSGTLHLYMVDWDRARRQTFDVTDGGGTRSYSLAGEFNDGVWLNVPVTVGAGGMVRVTVAKAAGSNSNVVLSGVFLGGGQPPAFSVSPQGDWVGAFGADGYALAAWEGVGAGDDLVVLPGASLTVEQGDRYQWQVPTGDVRALEAPGETERRAATWYHASQVRVRLDFAAAYSGTLHLYMVDWDRARRQTFDVTDGGGTRSYSLAGEFNDGVWLNVPVTVGAGGMVRVTVAKAAGSNSNVVLSGVFLGGGPA